ncbi:MAG: hypothetical protein A2275_17075 [Bacteroidetes bacterium RIFOXYA12_FULL_35_11]|nr:MAG: hypothetical protein A2X01_18210 [Bacteroidetes bacterium GWF2_35_48]OFY83402.1 MAG: hypothetical protein A2275_17075 [Bacteroidetes bacterium RIFOXYA12_FULL_35_11]HBX51686.1 hypothetical protein [Bacteroidales bacterium]
MSKHGTIRRYTLIIEKINRGHHPSFDEIKEYLFDHGFEISARTIQRDIEQIRYEFGFEILYNRDKNGYYIDFENCINTESFLRFLEIVNTAELLTESLSENKDTLKYISFDNSGVFKGTENIKPLLQAIKNNRIVTYKHFNYHTGKTNSYTLKPYLLREYQNRWYIIGTINKNSEFRTFGLDRVQNLIITTETFKPDKKANPAELFENTIGVVYSYHEQQKVILSFTSVQGKYIKSLPLHKSQRIIIDNEDELRIELNVIPNYELSQLILMHGETVKVIEPVWLIDEIKETLKASLKQYK